MAKDLYWIKNNIDALLRLVLQTCYCAIADAAQTAITQLNLRLDQLLSSLAKVNTAASLSIFE